MNNHDDSCEAQGPGESCCCVYRAEIERLRGLLREALPVIPLFGEWKQSGGMLVRTENGLLARIKEALGDENT